MTEQSLGNWSPWWRQTIGRLAHRSASSCCPSSSGRRWRCRGRPAQIHPKPGPCPGFLSSYLRIGYWLALPKSQRSSPFPPLTPSLGSSSRRCPCSPLATAIRLSSCLRRQRSRTGRRSGYPSSCRGRSLCPRSCCRRGRLRRRSHWSTSPRRPLPWWPQQGFNNPRN